MKKVRTIVTRHYKPKSDDNGRSLDELHSEGIAHAVADGATTEAPDGHVLLWHSSKLRTRQSGVIRLSSGGIHYVEMGLDPYIEGLKWSETSLNIASAKNTHDGQVDLDGFVDYILQRPVKHGDFIAAPGTEYAGLPLTDETPIECGLRIGQHIAKALRYASRMTPDGKQTDSYAYSHCPAVDFGLIDLLEEADKEIKSAKDFGGAIKPGEFFVVNFELDADNVLKAEPTLEFRDEIYKVQKQAFFDYR